MRRALLGLWLRSLRNRVLHALRRLRNPRRLVGLLIGGGYFFWIFTISFRDRGDLDKLPGAQLTGDLARLLLPPALTILVLGGLLIVWLLPSWRLFRASRAEATWLLQAPVPPGALAQSYILRDQVSVLISAAVSGFFLRYLLGGSWLLATLAMWFFVTLVTLHSNMAAAVRLRLRARRGRFLSWLVPAAAALAPLGLLALTFDLPGLRDLLQAAPAGDQAGLESFLPWLERFLDLRPLPVVLAPARLLASSLTTGVLTGLVLVAGHVLLASRMAAPILPEALLAAAEAEERREDVMKGRATRRRRRSAWNLSPRGSRLVGFLWKGLCSVGFWGSPAGLALPLLLPLGALAWSRLAPTGVPALRRTALLAGPVLLSGALILLLLQQRFIVRRGLYRDLGTLALMKTLPCRGAVVVLGETLAPVVVFSLWILSLGWSGLLLLSSGRETGFGLVSVLGIGGGLGLYVPFMMLVTSLMLVGLLLLYPDLVSSVYSSSKGMEAVGQRILMAIVNLLGFALLQLPALLAGLVAGIPAAALLALVGLAPLGFLVGGAVAALVLALECVPLLYFLEARYELFDVSEELTD